ncbi:hypothetical protein [Nostoc sp.]|uniref:hypothetical protein n=1 Tax=Nostoc sp. TaxID=1180 RepID=UPI002FF5DBFE
MNLPPNSSTSLNSLMLINRDQSLCSKRSRSRGLVLTRQGWQKLMQAGVLCDRYGNRYTYEILAGQSDLSPRTVSKILNSSFPVDKRTLTIFFNAFQLQLELDDYAIYNTILTEQATNSIKQYQAPEDYATELQLLVEEVMQLKERLEFYGQRFKLLDLAESGQNV